MDRKSKTGLNDMLKTIYSEEAAVIKTKPYPGGCLKFKSKPDLFLFAKAACAILILTGALLLISTAAPGATLGVAAAQFSQAYRLNEKIPAGIAYLQKVYLSGRNMPEKR